MPEMPRPRRLAWLAPLALLGLLAVALPSVALGRNGGSLAAPEINLAAVPGEERCTEGSPNPDAGLKHCDPPLITAGTLLPLFAGVVAAGVLALVVAYLVLRRRASAPLAPVDPGDWWTCPKCGATNVVGSARCYACGTWQR